MELRSIAQELHKKMLEEAKKPQKLIYNLTGKNIDDLKDLAFCEEELEKLRNTMNMYNRLLDQLSKILSLPPTDIEVMMKEIVTESLKANYYTTSLLILSIIACPHTTSSRYPDSKKNWNPIEKYTESTPLIKMLPSFINEVEEALNHLSKLINPI